jgi:hypothetical protein
MRYQINIFELFIIVIYIAEGNWGLQVFIWKTWKKNPKNPVDPVKKQKYR